MISIKKNLKFIINLISTRDFRLISPDSPVLPMISFKDKNMTIVHINCYQIVSLERISPLEYSISTQNNRWYIEKREFERISKLIAK